MSAGVGIWRCKGCGAPFFPERLLCARCHGCTFEQDRIFEAVVEEVTTVRHVLGQASWQPRRLANVRAGNGLLMTVGLRDASQPGDCIALFEEHGAPFGHAKVD